jgi:MFS transporter, NNP family, nitrate/nitrite transporter
VLINLKNHSTEQGKPISSIYNLSSIGPILFITLIFFLTFVARVLISPLMPEIEESLGISHAQSGSLFLFMSFGYFLALMGSGYISARIFHRNTITLSAMGVGVALCAISLSSGFIELIGSVFFLGFAAGLYLPSGITTLTNMVESNQWGKAISIHEIAPNLGFVAAPLIAELMLIYFSWRIIPSLIGIFTICVGFLFVFRSKAGNFPGKSPGSDTFRVLFAKQDFWIMVVLFGLAISSTLGLYIILPLYLVSEVGISRNSANTLIAVSRLLGLLSALAGGWAADRFGPGRTIMIILGLTGVSTILMGILSEPAVVVTWVFIQAVMATCYFPAGFAMLSLICPPGFQNIAISFTIPFAFLFGGGVVPWIIGMTGDAGSFSAGIIIIGGFITAGAALPHFLRVKKKG